MLPGIQHRHIRLERIEECPVVPGAIGDDHQLQIGPLCQPVKELPAQLPLQALLAGLGKTAQIDALQHVALGIQERRHAAGCLPPAGRDLLAIHLFGMHAQHDTVKGDHDCHRIRVGLLFCHQFAGDLAGIRLEAATSLAGEARQRRDRRAGAGEPGPGLGALPGSEVGGKPQRQPGRRRCQAALGQAEDGLGREE